MLGYVFVTQEALQGPPRSAPPVVAAFTEVAVVALVAVFAAHNLLRPSLCGASIGPAGGMAYGLGRPRRGPPGTTAAADAAGPRTGSALDCPAALPPRR